MCLDLRWPFLTQLVGGPQYNKAAVGAQRAQYCACLPLRDMYLMSKLLFVQKKRDIHQVIRAFDSPLLIYVGSKWSLPLCNPKPTTKWRKRAPCASLYTIQRPLPHALPRRHSHCRLLYFIFRITDNLRLFSILEFSVLNFVW